MPVYEYKCLKCGEKIEVMQKINDDLLSECDSCGGELKKVIGNTSFVLKGGGWYADGYNKKTKGAKKAKPAQKTDGASKPKNPLKLDS